MGVFSNWPELGAVMLAESRTEDWRVGQGKERSDWPMWQYVGLPTFSDPIELGRAEFFHHSWPFTSHTYFSNKD